MRKDFLSFSPPLIGEEEISEVVDTLQSDWITTGPKVKQFEKDFRDFIGAEASLATSSATDAMLIGLAALGIGDGDEVITSPMTFCSTVNVIEHLGATPVFVDVVPETLNIDPESFQEAITPKTKAVMPVHLYGHPCDMDPILELAANPEIFILEDAAHALPAFYNGRQVGTIGDLTAFSFYATKNLTTGEGGMLTGAHDLIEEARIWSLHGMSKGAWNRYSEKGSWYYEVVRPGFKCNMTDIQASIGIHQLRKLSEFQERRIEIVQRYNHALADISAIQLPIEKSEVKSAWHLYVIRLHLDKLNIDRNQFIDEMAARKIGTSVHFIPVHIHPYYRDKYGYKPEDFPVAFQEYQRIISLPLNLQMSDQDVNDVISAVRDIVKENKR